MNHCIRSPFRFAIAFGTLLAVSLSGFANAQEADLATGKTTRVSGTTHLANDTSLPDLPVGITSFGAALLNDHIYVYGGHNGVAHKYYKDGQNKTLYSLNLKSPKKWEKVASEKGLQGLALVACKGNLYRMGGFEAQNAKGEDQDLVSSNEFARFNFQTKAWEKLAPMPTPRSSFDAVAVGSHIYVVGGWAMKGKDGKTEWEKSAIRIDVSKKDSQWEKLPQPPFVRRAVALGHADGKVFVVGGMQQKGGPTTAVDYFDIQSGKWHESKPLPKKGRMEGFGSSCFCVGGKLVVSAYSGNVYTWNSKTENWDDFGELETSRFFHRLIDIGQNRFAVLGGANMDSGKVFETEVFELPKK